MSRHLVWHADNQHFWRNSVANHKSAVKRHKQSLVRNERNRANRTRVKNAAKAVQEQVLAQDKDQALKQLRLATSVLDKAAGKGAIHWKKAARKISRMQRAVNAIEA
jgi:small subunit ribosomal protein S20